MDLNTEEAIKLFLEHLDQLPSELIISKLEHIEDDKHLYKYLDSLVKRAYDESKKYHGRLVPLYADYAPDKLLSFLRSSDHYPIKGN